MTNSLVPAEVIINPEKDEKSVIVTPELLQSMPNVREAFEYIDDVLEDDPVAYLRKLATHQYAFRHHFGTIHYAYREGTGKEKLVQWAPFSDGAPHSRPEDIARYADGDKSVSKSQAAPNSWRQSMKSAVTAELLRYAGYDMPVLTIFNVIPSRAYTSYERYQLKRGDFSASASILRHTLADLQDRLHGPSSETQLDDDGLHLQGASIGANNAAGVAARLHRTGEYDIKTLTAQEPVFVPKHLVDLALKFTVKANAGGPSELEAGVDYTELGRIPEIALLQRMDRDGNEAATFARMALGMSKLGRNRGMTHPDTNRTRMHMLYLAEQGIVPLVAVGEHSGITQATVRYVPEGAARYVNIRAEKGTRATHLIDEHVALTALMTVLNIRSQAGATSRPRR